MQHVYPTPPTMFSSLQTGTRIPPLTRAEAGSLAAEELNRFLALVESLKGDDWQQRTACPLWSVQDIVAHQAAHVVGFVTMGTLMGQFSPALLFPYMRKGMSFLDALNQAQVDMRRDVSPDGLIAEIRNAVQRSLDGRQRLPGFLLAPVMPMPGVDQPRSMGYLFDVVYTRDMWMHRIDICRATGHEMPLDAKHDGRMVALIVRDLAEKSERGLGGRSAVLELTGPAGGSYQIGPDSTPEAVVEMDTLAFCILTSGRETAANVLAGGHSTLSGDTAFGREVVQFCENRVLY